MRKKDTGMAKLDAAFTILSNASARRLEPVELNESQLFGNLVSSKLQKYSDATRTAVQKAIMNILFNADRGSYNMPQSSIPSHVHNLPPSQMPLHVHTPAFPLNPSTSSYNNNSPYTTISSSGSPSVSPHSPHSPHYLQLHSTPAPISVVAPVASTSTASVPLVDFSSVTF